MRVNTRVGKNHLPRQMPLIAQDEGQQEVFLAKQRLLFDTSSLNYLIRTRQRDAVEALFERLQSQAYKLVFADEILLELAFGPVNLQNQEERYWLRLIQRLPALNYPDDFHMIENKLKNEPPRYRVMSNEFETFATQYVLRQLMEHTESTQPAKQARQMTSDARILVTAHNHRCITVTENKKDFLLLRDFINSNVRPPIISVEQLEESLERDVQCE